jgi:hypothetical protein
MGKKNKKGDYLERAFKKLGVKPVVYHFREVLPFEGITVAIVKQKRNTVAKEIMGSFLKAVRDRAITIARDEDAIKRLMTEYSDETSEPPYGDASCVKYIMERNGIPGISICDKGDQFNRKHGVDAAKGRLISSIMRPKSGRRFKTIELFKEV